jgi:hypothetical protein
MVHTSTQKKNIFKKIVMKPSLLILVAMLSLTGCFSPESVYNLIPAEGEIQWDNGVGTVSKTDQDISATVGYVENRNGLLSFNLIIENKSEKNIFIDPRQFKCVDKTHLSDKNDLQSKNAASSAVDPEIRIQQLDNEISLENADYESFTAFDAVGSILNLVIAIGSIGEQKSDEEIRNEELQAEDNQRRCAERENEHLNRIESLNNEKAFWQSQALRKTTILPNQVIGGNVYFIPVFDAKLVELHFPIEQTYFEFLFEQKKTNHK